MSKSSIIHQAVKTYILNWLKSPEIITTQQIKSNAGKVNKGSKRAMKCTDLTTQKVTIYESAIAAAKSNGITKNILNHTLKRNKGIRKNLKFEYL